MNKGLETYSTKANTKYQVIRANMFIKKSGNHISDIFISPEHQMAEINGRNREMNRGQGLTP